MRMDSEGCESKGLLALGIAFLSKLGVLSEALSGALMSLHFPLILSEAFLGVPMLHFFAALEGSAV